MRYRGYEIYVSRSNIGEGLLGANPPRLSCEIYTISDPDLNTMLDCFTLTQGEEIADLSDASVDEAIRKYVDCEYGHLYSTELEVTSERTQLIMGRLIRQLGQAWSGPTVYDTLSNEIGMTDDEIRAAGASHLVRYFDRDEYAKTIADHMILVGTENTITGSWDIDYQYLNRKFYTDLPGDKTMVKKIGDSLNANCPESIQDFTVNDRGFHVKFNPMACHHVWEEETEHPGMVQSM